jgi:thiol-disulfide isomerase/thioredoxin
VNEPAAARPGWRRPWVWVGVWAAAILTATSVPLPVMPGTPSHLDKVVHVGMYLPLAWLLARALGEGRRARLLPTVLWAFVLAGLFGAFDEWHQRYMPTRSCDLCDFEADLTGIFLGCIIGAWPYGRYRRGEVIMAEPQPLVTADFEGERTQPGVMIVDFWMNGCGHCSHYAPTFDALAAELCGLARLFKVEARENLDLSRQFQIRGVPTTVVFKDGEEVQRTTGAKTLEEMREWLNPVL